MTVKKCLLTAVIAVGAVVVMSEDSQAFFGRRGSHGSCGSSGGGWGSGGSWGVLTARMVAGDGAAAAMVAGVRMVQLAARTVRTVSYGGGYSVTYYGDGGYARRGVVYDRVVVRESKPVTIASAAGRQDPFDASRSGGSEGDAGWR